MRLSKFLEGVNEASYIIYANQGNDHLCVGGHGFVILSDEGVYIRDMIVANLEGVVEEPDEFGAATGHFKVADVQLDVTVRRGVTE